MKNPDVIIFTNLRQADQQIAGQTQAVKAIRPTAGHFSQPNAEGALWRPTSLGDVTARATARAARFREMLKKTPTASLRLNVDPFDDRHSKASNLPPWKGTVVGIDITLDQTTQFLSLLKAIRAVYHPAAKKRKKAKYKARFI